MNLENIMKLDELSAKVDSIERGMGAYHAELEVINNLEKAVAAMSSHIHKLNKAYDAYAAEMRSVKDRIGQLTSLEVKNVVACEMQEIDEKYKTLFSFLSEDNNKFANMLVNDSSEAARAFAKADDVPSTEAVSETVAQMPPKEEIPVIPETAPETAPEAVTEATLDTADITVEMLLNQMNETEAAAPSQAGDLDISFDMPLKEVTGDDIPGIGIKDQMIDALAQ